MIMKPTPEMQAPRHGVDSSMLAYKNLMLICSRRHSRAFLTDIFANLK